MLILNACNVLKWLATIRTQTLEFQPGEDTFSVDESLATSKSKYVHVWLIIETMTDIQRIDGTSSGGCHIQRIEGTTSGGCRCCRCVPPPRPCSVVLFPKYSDWSSFFYSTNNKIVIATFQETFPVLGDHSSDIPNTVR